MDLYEPVKLFQTWNRDRWDTWQNSWRQKNGFRLKLEVAYWNPTLVFWILARKHPIVPKFFSICPSLTTNNGQWKSWRWDTWQNFGDKKMVSGWKTRSCGLESHFSILNFSKKTSNCSKIFQYLSEFNDQ